jgi:hypothetical protein
MKVMVYQIPPSLYTGKDNQAKNMHIELMLERELWEQSTIH